MNRSSLDKLISSAGLITAITLLAASGALFWAHNFIHNQVKTQLVSEKIVFPAAGSDQIAALPVEDQTAINRYAGEQVINGAQAKVFADNYIKVHLAKIGGGQTYSELSAASLADPANTKLAGQVQTVFRGETLRGLLLNAYAFDTMGLVALCMAYGSLIAAALLGILALLGFRHAGTVKKR